MTTRADFSTRVVHPSGVSYVHNHLVHCRLPSLYKRQLVSQWICIILPVRLIIPVSEFAILIKNLSDIGLVTAAYLFWKFFKKTSIVALEDIPLKKAIERAQGDPGVIENVPRWRKVAGFLWD